MLIDLSPYSAVTVYFAARLVTYRGIPSHTLLNHVTSKYCATYPLAVDSGVRESGLELAVLAVPLESVVAVPLPQWRL